MNNSERLRAAQQKVQSAIWDVAGVEPNGYARFAVLVDISRGQLTAAADHIKEAIEASSARQSGPWSSGSDIFTEAATKHVQEITKLVDRAIVAWSSAAGMNPSEWLERWRPVLSQEIGEDMSLRIVVRAAPIEELPQPPARFDEEKPPATKSGDQ